jgi:hypothetical protein
VGQGWNETGSSYRAHQSRPARASGRAQQDDSGSSCTAAVEAATALGCRDVLFTLEGEVRAGLFCALDGVARREVSTELAAAAPFTIEHEAGCITVTVKLVIRGPAQSQLAYSASQWKWAMLQLSAP